MAVRIDGIDQRMSLPHPAVSPTGDDGGGCCSATDRSSQPDLARPRVDPVAHRVDVVRRLHARGVTIRALEALLPGWERAIHQLLDGPEER